MKTESGEVVNVLYEFTTTDRLPPRSRFQPGDVFGFVIHKITGQLTANCGKCGARKIQMNIWGLSGCLKNRKIIQGWLHEEALKRGVKISNSKLSSLLVAAFKEIRKRQGK